MYLNRLIQSQHSVISSVFFCSVVFSDITLFLLVVLLKMVLQVVLIPVGLLAVRAGKWPGSCVGLKVVFDVAGLQKNLLTAVNLAYVVDA